MRTYKNTVLILIPVCIVCLATSFFLEFKLVLMRHNSFYTNVAMGMFTSGILVILTSIISYMQEKKRYYKMVFSELAEMLIYSRTLIEGMKNRDKNLKPSMILDKIKVNYDNIKISMWDYVYFFKRNQKDIVVDSSMSVMTKVLYLLGIIYDASNDLNNNKISMETYEYTFNTVTDECINTYDPQLADCEQEVRNTISILVKDRKLNSIFDKQNKETF